MKKRVFILTALALVLTLTVPQAAVLAVTEGTEPKAENMEFTTFRDVSMQGRLSAADPEGLMLTYEMTTEPRKGALALEADGSFVYTPDSGKKGKDYFGYKVQNSNGVWSQEATVIIKIEKQTTKISYDDMNGSGYEYAALVLAEEGIFTGSCLGGHYMFEPTRMVSRGEFLAMCMKATNTATLGGVVRTGFADDDSIPMWVKPYVSTALMSGVITGYAGDGISGPLFDSEAPISFTEAAVMLDRVLNVTDTAQTSPEEIAAPEWAYQSVANLSAYGVMPTYGIIFAQSDVTRAAAAEMLTAAMQLTIED